MSHIHPLNHAWWKPAVVFAAAVLPFFVSAGESIFPDPNLEAAVRRQVFEKRDTSDPILAEDVAKISVVEANGMGITNLAGLEKCPSLAMLQLAGNNVTDLSPLRGLSRLQYLDVRSNRLENIEPLAELSALQYLDLTGNRVADASPLAGLTNLSALYLTGNRLEDVSALRGLRRLSSLYLDSNRLWEMDGLHELGGLSSLSLSDNAIRELKLDGFRNLRHLFLEGNRIADLAPLVKWVEADTEQRFAPYLNLYLKGNPLSGEALEKQLPRLEAAGVRVHR